MVKRAYEYRSYPTPEQVQQLSPTFGCVRYVYNRALAERSRAWTQDQRRISYAESDKMLTGWKRDPETAWLTEPSKGPLQAALRNLQGAFDKFWRKQTRYPQFKKKGRSKDSATYFSNCFTYRNGRIKLAKHSEPLDIRWSRPLPEGVQPSQVTVSRDSAGRYHISILIEETISEHTQPKPPWVWMRASPRCTRSRRFPTPDTRNRTGPRWRRLSVPCPGNRRARTTGPKHVCGSRVSTLGSPTAAGTICTNSPLGWCAKTK